MGRVQQYAEGFLSLIGNKVGGREPTALSDVVMPTVDMTELFLGRKLTTSRELSTATSAYLDSLTISVPDGKIWLLMNVSTNVALTASTQRVVFRAGLRNLDGDPLQANMIMGSADAYDAAISATHTLTQVKNFARPYVLHPGIDILYEVIDTNNAIATWSAHASYYELDA